MCLTMMTWTRRCSRCSRYDTPAAHHITSHHTTQLLGPLDHWVDTDHGNTAPPHLLSTSEGVYISSCGHAMHLDCYARFQAGRHDVLDGRITLQCPLCRGAYNTTLPVHALHIRPADGTVQGLSAVHVITAALGTYPSVPFTETPQPRSSTSTGMRQRLMCTDQQAK